MTAITVLSGPERRRRWSASEKDRIVAESLVPGAVIADVARRHDVHPNLLYWWRRQAREAPTGGDADRLVPVRIARTDRSASSASHSAVVEVVLGNGVVLRVPEGAAVERTAQLAAALSGLAR